MKLWVEVPRDVPGATVTYQPPTYRTATSADILAAFVAQCEAGGVVEKLRRRLARLDAETERQEQGGGDPMYSMGSAGTLMLVLDDLGLSPLLEPKPTEEVTG